MFKAFLQSQSDNATQLGDYFRVPYQHGEDPAHTALRNELFTAFKKGMLYSTQILPQFIAALEADLAEE